MEGVVFGGHLRVAVNVTITSAAALAALYAVSGFAVGEEALTGRGASTESAIIMSTDSGLGVSDSILEEKAPKPAAKDKRSAFTYEGHKRSYSVHVPPSYDGKTAMPVVFVLHGARGSGRQAAGDYGWNELADKEGFIVVYPNGLAKPGQAAGPWRPYTICSPGVKFVSDDVGFISGIIDRLEKDMSIDAKRTYAAGISSGGMMAHRLAVELSERLAAVASVAGTLMCVSGRSVMAVNIPAPKKAIAVIAFHGKKDEVVPYDENKVMYEDQAKLTVFSVPQAISFWVEVDKCVRMPMRETSENGNVIKDTYTGGTDGAEVVLYTIQDGDHSWPGAKEGAAQHGRTTTEISATELIWEFFKEHPGK